MYTLLVLASRLVKVCRDNLKNAFQPFTLLAADFLISL